jgi:excisionase family DNA binding protein
VKRFSRMQEQVYTVDEVAHQLRVDPRTVRKWIHNGELLAIDVGREYRIRESSLQDFIKRREQRDIPTDT